MYDIMLYEVDFPSVKTDFNIIELQYFTYASA